MVYAYRQKKIPLPNDKFFVFEFEGADISDENWKQEISTQVLFETRGVGVGDVWFVLSNK